MRIYKHYHKIAKENNLEFRINDKYYSGKLLGVDFGTVSVDHYLFKKSFNNLEVELTNEFGNTNLAFAKCIVPNKPGLYPFKTNVSNVFWTMINKNKNRINIDCENQMFKLRVEKLLIDSGIEKLSKTLNFEPLITLTLKDFKWHLNMRYSLQFSGKENAVLVVFAFYKKFIHEFNLISTTMLNAE